MVTMWIGWIVVKAIKLGQKLVNTMNLMGLTSDFANDFYTSSDIFLDQDECDPFFGIDKFGVAEKGPELRVGDKGKGILIEI